MSSSLSSSKQAGANIFMSSIGWLANLIAFIASFLGTPFVYGKTIGWIHRYTAMNYGGGYVDLITFVHRSCLYRHSSRYGRPRHCGPLSRLNFERKQLCLNLASIAQ